MTNFYSYFSETLKKTPTIIVLILVIYVVQGCSTDTTENVTAPNQNNIDSGSGSGGSPSGGSGGSSSGDSGGSSSGGSGGSSSGGSGDSSSGDSGGSSSGDSGGSSSGGSDMAGSAMPDNKVPSNWITSELNFLDITDNTVKAGYLDMLFADSVLGMKTYAVLSTHPYRVTASKRPSSSTEAKEFTIKTYNEKDEIVHSLSLKYSNLDYNLFGSTYSALSVINSKQGGDADGYGIHFPYGIAGVSRHKYNSKIGLAFVFGALHSATAELALQTNAEEIPFVYNFTKAYSGASGTAFFGQSVASPTVESSIELSFSLIKTAVLANGETPTTAELADTNISKYKVISGLKLTSLSHEKSGAFYGTLKDKNKIIPINKIVPSKVLGGTKQFITFSHDLVDSSDWLDAVLELPLLSWRIVHLNFTGALYGKVKDPSVAGLSSLYLVSTVLLSVKDGNTLQNDNIATYRTWGITLHRLNQ